MRNIIRQIIDVYPENDIVITMESGNNVSGRANSLLPSTNTDAGLFQLANAQGILEGAVSICKIASIRIINGIYNELITYLPEPELIGCGADCEAAIRAYLPVGTDNVNVNLGGQTVAQGTVLKSEYGMVVIAGIDNSNPTFVSLCKVEIIDK